MSDKNCHKWLTVDKDIAIIKRFTCLLDHSGVYAIIRCHNKLPLMLLYNNVSASDRLISVCLYLFKNYMYCLTFS